MNSFSDIVGRKQTPEAKSDITTEFVMRKVEPKTLTAKLSAKASDTEGQDKRAMTDLLVQGLIDRLPKPESVWPLNDRAKWLRTADSIFNLVYKAEDDEHREMSIALIKQETQNPPVRATEKGKAGPSE